VIKAVAGLKELLDALFNNTKKFADLDFSGGLLDVKHYFMGRSDKENAAFWANMGTFGQRTPRGGTPDAPNVAIPMATPQERTARSIQENNTTSSADITLRTEKGTSAAVTRGSLGSYLNLLPSGAF